jgi:hypothetical protein
LLPQEKCGWDFFGTDKGTPCHKKLTTNKPKEFTNKTKQMEALHVHDTKEKEHEEEKKKEIPPPQVRTTP